MLHFSSLGYQSASNILTLLKSRISSIHTRIILPRWLNTRSCIRNSRITTSRIQLAMIFTELLVNCWWWHRRSGRFVLNLLNVDISMIFHGDLTLWLLCCLELTLIWRWISLQISLLVLPIRTVLAFHGNELILWPILLRNIWKLVIGLHHIVVKWVVANWILRLSISYCIYLIAIIICLVNLKWWLVVNAAPCIILLLSAKLGVNGVSPRFHSHVIEGT